MTGLDNSGENTYIVCLICPYFKKDILSLRKFYN